MISVGVRELKEQTSQIIKQVREQGAMIEVTYHGQAVARIIPMTSPTPNESQMSMLWAEMDELAAKIGQKWDSGVSAVEAVQEARRI